MSAIFGGLGLSHFIIKHYQKNINYFQIFLRVIPYIFVGSLVISIIFHKLFMANISVSVFFLYAFITNIAYSLTSLVRVHQSSFKASIIESFHGNIFILTAVILCYIVYGSDVSEVNFIIYYILLSFGLLIYIWFCVFKLKMSQLRLQFFDIRFDQLWACVVLTSTFSGIAFLRNVDILILESYISNYDLGKFKIITVIIYLPILFHGTIETLIIPKLRNGKERMKHDDYRSLTIKSFVFNVIITTLVGVAAYLLIDLVYSVEFHLIAHYLITGLLASSLLSIFGFYTSVLNYGGQHKYYALIIIAVNIFNLVCNLILIPIWFEFGAVLSTAMSLLLIGYLSSIRVKKILC
ncbi:polysaccharide biosynthesis C-terminal domain-containing protein [Amylibacter sp.]|nr:polysaccharide biosynthesis C-terminal domain-containing protein [Amylibacter sp.]